MARLHSGYKTLNERRREEAEAEANSTTGAKPIKSLSGRTRPRKSDRKALKQFADKHDLDIDQPA